MSDQEIDISAPYDNIEFPVRKAGTGTWPGPATSTGGGIAGAKLFGHQTTGRTGPRLATLVEIDYTEGNENNRLQTLNFGNTSSPQQISVASVNKSVNQTSTSNNVTTSANHTESSTNEASPAPNQITSTIPLAINTPSNIPQSVNTSSTIPHSMTTSLALSTHPQATPTTTWTTQSNKAEVDKNRKQTSSISSVDTLQYPEIISSADTSKKKAMRYIETEEEDFKRQDLNPDARLALEVLYTRHSDFYQLNSKVLDEGSLLKRDVLDIYRRTGETLTYEQLLQGMLVDGERFLLNNCWLFYTHVQFLDVEGTKTLREPYGRGRIGLTSKRALFLSTETYTGASLEQFELADRKKNQEKTGFKLEVSKRSAITFKNIPLGNFHSAEMEVIMGAAVQTKITKQSGCCGCLGITAGKWVSTPPMTRSINTRVLRVGVSMPPWQTRMFMDIHLDPTMSLTVARDFISQLHAFAPHMH